MYSLHTSFFLKLLFLFKNKYILVLFLLVLILVWLNDIEYIAFVRITLQITIITIHIIILHIFNLPAPYLIQAKA